VVHGGVWLVVTQGLLGWICTDLNLFANFLQDDSNDKTRIVKVFD
jgi:hypothetical protein